LIKGYPFECRASWFGRNFWCSEEVRIKATVKRCRTSVYSKRPVEIGGTKIHNILERRVFPKETVRFWNMVKTIEPLYFEFQKTKIFFHPDAFLVQNGVIKIIEYKTVDGKPNRFIYPMGRVQLMVYLYGLQKLLDESLPKFYSLAKNRHRVMYWKRFTKTKRKIRLVDVQFVSWNSEVKQEIEDIIKSCFLIWEKKVLPFPPSEFKCRQCPFYIRRYCRFYTGEIPLSWKNWSVRFAKNVPYLSRKRLKTRLRSMYSSAQTFLVEHDEEERWLG